MKFTKPDTTYWNRKLQAYLHDPFDKVFKISEHERRASELLEILGEQLENINFWQDADIIASSIERATLPGFHNDESKSGAVNFAEFPLITHPTGAEQPLRFDIPKSVTPENIIEELKENLKNYIGTKVGEGGISDSFAGKPDDFAIARFFYLHLVLRFKLAENENSHLGQLWHRLPADSRFPDHSIWNHCQLVSAFNSCMDFATTQIGKDFQKIRRENIAISVFSITPVQEFISKSRKLRDYWSSSIMLSYLSFEGIRWVMEHLGPDHILYPSMMDQPLITEYLKKRFSLMGVNLWKNHPKGVATFPNKFVFLTPKNRAEEIRISIEEHIRKEWLTIYEKVRTFTEKKFLIDEKSDYYKNLWERETSNFWEFKFASVKLIDIADKGELKELFEKSAIEKELETEECFKKMSQILYHNDARDPSLYGISHSLVQTLLASQKASRKVPMREEPGEKCHLCGEFEVLHTEDCRDKRGSEYSKHIKAVWSKIRDEAYEADTKPNERLCAICTVKRFLPLVMADESNKDSLLYSVFKKSETFPSTPEIALYDFSKRNKNKKIREIAKKLYAGEEVKEVKNKDKYYAILIMDGDKMGDLINGKTIGATWSSIMHPKIKEKIEGNNKFPKEIIDGWKKLLKEKVRNMIPSVHASISESLGDFAIYGVVPIIEKYGGKLIYAGGDDVAAVLPIQNVLEAAKEIKNYYTHSFRSIGVDGKSEVVSEIAKNRAGKLSVGLGKSEGISISAGILICHFKEPLSQMILDAHNLLDNVAKRICNRNACAIKLRKRAGGDRIFYAKWDDNEKWEAFKKFSNAIKTTDSLSVSTSLIYRLEKFRDGIEAILKTENDEILQKFLEKQLSRSEKGSELDTSNIAKIMKEICVYEKINEKGEKEKIFDPERLIVAAFLASTNQSEAKQIEEIKEEEEKK